MLASVVLIACAGVHLAQGRRSLAIELLDASIDRQPPDGQLVAALARYHRGRLTGGEAGEAERADATRLLRELGVMDIRVLSAALAPLLYATQAPTPGVA